MKGGDGEMEVKSKSEEELREGIVEDEETDLFLLITISQRFSEIGITDGTSSPNSVVVFQIVLQLAHFSAVHL